MTADSEYHSSAAAAEELQGGASVAAGRVKSQVRDFAEQQKSDGADQIGETAEAVEAAADDLKDKAPKAAEYVRDLAGRLDAIADNLRENSADELIGKAADFARKQPAVFFAGAVATGFALSCFRKSFASRGA